MDKKKTKNKNHNKKKYTASNQLAKFRGWIQAGATLLTNIHLPNFFKGEIYQGKGKAVCVPGLNCYSCPAASGACPIGSFQAVVGSSKYKFSYYITGFLILLGVLLGRFVCGFLCPFGWLQDLLHKSYSSIHTIRGVLRPAFQMAVDDDILVKNPFGFQLAGVLVNDAVTREVIYKDQMRKFLKFVHDDRRV